MIQNKKGQGLSTSTIVLLILGLIILVILIWGFVTGWSSFRSLVNPSNVNDVVQACGQACSISNVYSYCSGERTLRANEDNLEIKSSCAVFSQMSVFSKYRISPCPTISCELNCADIVIDGRRGAKTNSADQVRYDVSSFAVDLDVGERCVIN